MVRPTTCPQPSSSAGGGSRRRPKLPELVNAPAPPSRRLGGELTSLSGTPGPGVRPPSAGTSRRVAALLKGGIYRFHYHRHCEAIAVTQIQAAESPENLGRFNPWRRSTSS